MSKVLYIKANPKKTPDSFTLRMAAGFIEAYQEAHPQDEIITLDLYQEDLKFLDEQMLADIFSGKETVMLKHAKQFAGADKYIIAAPLWNLGIPAILKAYFDYVTMVGVTFQYTAQGPVGLLKDQGKKAVHIVARGGKYSEPPASDYEMGDRYLRTIMGFMGITDFTTITTELTGVLQGEELEKSVQQSIEVAKKTAKIF